MQCFLIKTPLLLYYFNQTKLTKGVDTVGSCVTSCTPDLTICTNSDFGNKQGPICFVGQFGDDAVATACLTGQKCQVNVIHKSFNF